MTRPAQHAGRKPLTLKVWVSPDVKDEMRRMGNIIGYEKRGGFRRVRATLTLNHPKQAGRSR